MSSDAVERLLAEYVQQEIDPDGPGLYFWCELCDGDGPLKETVDHKDDCPIGVLEAQAKEVERLREKVRVARVHLTNGMPASAFAALEEQEMTDERTQR